jgi:hypothetical protein
VLLKNPLLKTYTWSAQFQLIRPAKVKSSKPKSSDAEFLDLQHTFESLP